MRFSRRLKSCTGSYLIRSEYIREELGIYEVSYKIEESKGNCKQHLRKMNIKEYH
jgi:hypothetical protein